MLNPLDNLALFHAHETPDPVRPRADEILSARVHTNPIHISRMRRFNHVSRLGTIIASLPQANDFIRASREKQVGGAGPSNTRDFLSAMRFCHLALYFAGSNVDQRDCAVFSGGYGEVGGGLQVQAEDPGVRGGVEGADVAGLGEGGEGFGGGKSRCGFALAADFG
jgi:hypothetical protein